MIHCPSLDVYQQCNLAINFCACIWQVTNVTVSSSRPPQAVAFVQNFTGGGCSRTSRQFHPFLVNCFGAWKRLECRTRFNYGQFHPFLMDCFGACKRLACRTQFNHGQFHPFLLDCFVTVLTRFHIEQGGNYWIFLSLPVSYLVDFQDERAALPLLRLLKNVSIYPPLIPAPSPRP